MVGSDGTLRSRLTFEFTIMPPILPGRPSPEHFPSTHWSRVLAAGNPDAPEAFEALANLCQAYWYPIYAYVGARATHPSKHRT